MHGETYNQEKLTIFWHWYIKSHIELLTIFELLARKTNKSHLNQFHEKQEKAVSKGTKKRSNRGELEKGFPGQILEQSNTSTRS